MFTMIEVFSDDFNFISVSLSMLADGIWIAALYYGYRNER